MPLRSQMISRISRELRQRTKDQNISSLKIIMRNINDKMSLMLLEFDITLQ